MSTVQISHIASTSLEDTLALAAKIGNKLKGGEVIELVSDLGGGKTAFVRGLARGMGSTDNVSSPSFTIMNQYRADDLTLYHYDFYRLAEAGIMRDELAEALADPVAIVVVEWADIIADVLPVQRVTINIAATSEEGRLLDVSYPEKFSYLLGGISA